MDSAKLAELGDRAMRLHKLSEHEGWDELRRAFEVRKEKWTRNLAQRLLLKDSTIDQREIDWQNGFLAGCKWLLDNPDMAEETLEKALRQVERMKSH